MTFEPHSLSPDRIFSDEEPTTARPVPMMDGRPGFPVPGPVWPNWPHSPFAPPHPYPVTLGRR